MNIGPMAYFQEQLYKGRFMIQRSRSSGQHMFYPRAIEPGTGDDDLEWVQACGKGQVYACTTVYPRKKPPYNISIVQLDEGPRLMSRIVDIDPESVSIGMQVYARIDANPNTPTGMPTHVLLFSAQQQSLPSKVAP
mgnify:CR=1 FL=1